MVVPGLEEGRARRSSSRSQVLTPERLGLRGAKRASVADWVVKLLRKVNVRAVTVPASFPYGIGQRLKRAGIQVSVAKTGLFPERAVKSTDELRRIRESQQAAVIAMRVAVTMIANSKIDRGGYLRTDRKRLTSNDVRLALRRILLNHNCFCREIIVAGGRQSMDPHESGSGPLRAREPIVIDIFPEHLAHGYWGDLTRTVVKGEPSPLLKKMYHAVKGAQNAALKCVKAGVKCATVHQAAAADLRRRGFKTGIVEGKGVGFIHATGHGVGLALHEPPSIGDTDGRLRSGNVITIEPGLYYSDIGGVRIEDTVVVTRSGWQYLVPCENRFEL